jgi:hypothetical protein
VESLEALGIVFSHGEGDAAVWTALGPLALQTRVTPVSA